MREFCRCVCLYITHSLPVEWSFGDVTVLVVSMAGGLKKSFSLKTSTSLQYDDHLVIKSCLALYSNAYQGGEKELNVE